MTFFFCKLFTKKKISDIKETENSKERKGEKKMTKVKILLSTLLTGLILFIAPSLVNAAETFTTSDGIVATKIVENTDGTVDFKLTNIALSAEGQYTWAVGTTSNGSDIPEKEWFTMGDFSETNKSAVLSLTPSVNSIKKILRTTNTAWLYIKDVANNKYVVDALKVDLTLPALKACVVTKSYHYNPGIPSNPAWELEMPYSIHNVYYKMEKITDENIIKGFKECNGDYSKLNLSSISNAPETGWVTSDDCGEIYAKQGVYNRDIPKDEGLYYLWIKGKDTDSKQIIGYTLINMDAECPTVKAIYVSSPVSGTYKTSQTIKIDVRFSEKITGTTVPTLKIRFGESPIRLLTNGTIENNTYYSNGCITYSYNIQSDDKGQLAAVGLEGGTIKDTSGNDAKLSCPLISGNTIKANTEGTTINQTDNQDKVNNNKSNNTVSNTNTTTKSNTTTNATTNNVSSQTNGTTGNTNTAKNTATNANTNKTTNTVAKSNTTTNTTQKVVNKLPKTGISLTIIFVIITIITIGAIAYIKYNNLKGI